MMAENYFAFAVGFAFVVMVQIAGMKGGLAFALGWSLAVAAAKIDAERVPPRG